MSEASFATSVPEIPWKIEQGSLSKILWFEELKTPKDFQL